MQDCMLKTLFQLGWILCYILLCNLDTFGPPYFQIVTPVSLLSAWVEAVFPSSSSSSRGGSKGD